MRGELNALEGPISKYKQNLRNCSSSSGHPRDQPLKLSYHLPRGPNTCSTVWPILEHMLEFVKQPLGVCISVGSLVVSQIRHLGQHPHDPSPPGLTSVPPTQADPQSPPRPQQLGTGPHTGPTGTVGTPAVPASQGKEGGFGRRHSHGGHRAPCPAWQLVTGRGLCP